MLNIKNTDCGDYCEGIILEFDLTSSSCKQISCSGLPSGLLMYKQISISNNSGFQISHIVGNNIVNCNGYDVNPITLCYYYSNPCA